MILECFYSFRLVYLFRFITCNDSIKVKCYAQFIIILVITIIDIYCW